MEEEFIVVIESRAGVELARFVGENNLSQAVEYKNKTSISYADDMGANSLREWGFYYNNYSNDLTIVFHKK